MRRHPMKVVTALLFFSILALPGVGFSENGTAEEPPAAASADGVAHEKLVAGILSRLVAAESKARIEAGIALREIATVSDVKRLVEMMRGGNKVETQIALIETLATIGDREALPALRFEIDHGEYSVKAAAISALGDLEEDWGVPILTEIVLSKEDIELRKRAASALGRIGTDRARYAIENNLGQVKDEGVREALKWAMLWAKRQVDLKQIDAKIPGGQNLELMFKGTKYYIYHPALRRFPQKKPRILLCVHGSSLNAREIFDVCRAAVKGQQIAVLAPVFDNILFPEYGQLNIRGERPDLRLLELVKHVGQVADLETKELYMFGYGLGGDFVQRFTLAYPERVGRAAAMTADFTMPKADVLFPAGLAVNPLAPDLKIKIEPFIKSDIALLVNAEETGLYSGKKYTQALFDYADVNGIVPRIAVRDVYSNTASLTDAWGMAKKFLFRVN